MVPSLLIYIIMSRQDFMSQPLLREFFYFFMGWKIVEIENADRLRLFLDNLVIYKEEDKIIIPINDIDTLIIDNVQYDLYGELLIAPAELFFYIDK